MKGQPSSEPCPSPRERDSSTLTPTRVLTWCRKEGSTNTPQHPVPGLVPGIGVAFPYIKHDTRTLVSFIVSSSPCSLSSCAFFYRMFSFMLSFPIIWYIYRLKYFRSAGSGLGITRSDRERIGLWTWNYCVGFWTTRTRAFWNEICSHGLIELEAICLLSIMWFLSTCHCLVCIGPILYTTATNASDEKNWVSIVRASRWTLLTSLLWVRSWWKRLSDFTTSFEISQ